MISFVHLVLKTILWINVHTKMIGGVRFFFLVLYVNDVLLATNDKSLLYEVKQFILKNMKGMDEASYVIAIKTHIERS